MVPKYVQHIATKLQLEPLHMGYLGSFEPSLPVPCRSSRGQAHFILPETLCFGVKLRGRQMAKMNHSWFSSYPLAIYRKEEGR